MRGDLLLHFLLLKGKRIYSLLSPKRRPNLLVSFFSRHFLPLTQCSDDAYGKTGREKICAEGP